MREYFCAYHSMLGAMRKLSDAECGRLFRALLMYSSGEEPNNLQGREELLFDVFSQQIDRDDEKYKTKCESNRANASVRKRSQAIASDGSQEKEKDKEESSTARAEFMTAEEAADIMQGHQQVFDEAKRWGFPANTGTYDALTEMISLHGIDRMLSAIKDCGEHGAPKLPYLRKVLADTPKAVPQQETRMQRLF